jgi:hypothetical protein
MWQPTPDYGQPAGRLIDFGDDPVEAYKVNPEEQSEAYGCKQSFDSDFSPTLKSVQI